MADLFTTHSAPCRPRQATAACYVQGGQALRAPLGTYNEKKKYKKLTTIVSLTTNQ